MSLKSWNLYKTISRFFHTESPYSYTVLDGGKIKFIQFIMFMSKLIYIKTGLETLNITMKIFQTSLKTLEITPLYLVTK